MSAPKKIYLSKLVMAGAEILDKPVSDDDVEYIRADIIRDGNSEIPNDQPLPEDTVLFKKGVEEGKRLAEEEQADLFTIVALDAAQRAKEQMLKEAVEGTIDYVYDEKGDAYKAIRIDWLVGDFGDKVRVIVLPQKD